MRCSFQPNRKRQPMGLRRNTARSSVNRTPSRSPTHPPHPIPTPPPPPPENPSLQLEEGDPGAAKWFSVVLSVFTAYCWLPIHIQTHCMVTVFGGGGPTSCLPCVVVTSASVILSHLNSSSAVLNPILLYASYSKFSK